MKNSLKKAIVVLLSAAMLLSLSALSVSALEGAPSAAVTAKATDAVEIASAEDFAKIADNLGGNYILTADITLERGLSQGEESKVFTGTFDGNGHKITLNVSATRWRNGVFCTAGGENCVIKNLTVDGTVTSEDNSSGGVVGTAKGNILFENITSEISITSTADGEGSGGTGGILGVNEGCTVTFKNCTSKAKVVGKRAAGGFVGMVRNGGAKEVFENCVFEGDVRCDTEWSDKRAAGGFVGILHKSTNDEVAVSFTKCQSNGKVTSDYVLASAWVGSYARHGHPDQIPTYTDCSQTATVIHNGLEISKISDTRSMEGMDSQTSGRLTFDAAAKTVTVDSNMAMNAETLAAKVAAGVKVYVGGVLDEKAEVTVSDRNLKVVSKDPTVKEGEIVTVVVLFSDGAITTLSQSKEVFNEGNEARLINFTATGANASSTDPTVNLHAEVKPDPDPDPDPTPDPDPDPDPDPEAPKTGSAVAALGLTAILSLAGVTIASKKRK